MNAKDLKAVKDQIVELLAPYTDEGRKKIMAEVGKHFCLLCWEKLNGGKCFCAPGYDI